MAVWPLTLPQSMLSGITDEMQDTRIRSSTDVGPAIVRQRYTAGVRNVDVPITLTAAERVIFETFYHTTLNEGTFSFTWTDPIDASAKSYRFRENKGPTFELHEGGTFQRHDTTLKLEIIP